MHFLRRIELIAEIAYKSRTMFLRVQNNTRSMAPRLPVNSTVTVKTDVNRFYVGDIVGINVNSEGPMLREVSAGPGSVIEGACGSSFTLKTDQYWVESRNPGHGADSRDFGPLSLDVHIMGRAVHCSTMQHWINNSATARTEDVADNWLIPLAPQTLSDLAFLWAKTKDQQFLDQVLPMNHRASSAGKIAMPKETLVSVDL